ncbi:hypothetical protein N658DRAFT_54502 [Parathielavia hyrcaniae]|uniref:Uncharacterized protein n=1 Tax=Parathielavia hyrcaniae TaxID=113614 RepID=A0AAN6Q1A3_9PEZI|nr:hypothetical protein N658DRAFT_54502 [Parathielavia hyrcaniae]
MPVHAHADGRPSSSSFSHTLARRRSRATIRLKAQCNTSSSRRLRSKAAAAVGVSRAVWRRCVVALSASRAASAAQNAASAVWTARPGALIKSACILHTCLRYSDRPTSEVMERFYVIHRCIEVLHVLHS